MTSKKSLGVSRCHVMCSGSSEAAPYTLSPPEPDHAMLRSNSIRRTLFGVRAQLSLVVADLAKLRYVKKAKQLGSGRHDMDRKTTQDDRNTFSTLLGHVMDARHDHSTL